MGSHMVRHLLNLYPDYHIVNLDKMTYAGNLDNLKDVADDPRYTFVQGDISDKALLDRIIPEHKIDVIINYAAETHVDRSIMDPLAFLHTNVIGVYQLLEATHRHGLKKMIQISTDEVFGSVEDGKFTEDSPFLPNSPYSAAKAAGDLLCRSYFITYQTPVVVTHSCNFYGPYQYPEKLISLFITNLLEGKKVPMYGDGKNVREWIYTSDHCRAVDIILHKGVEGGVYNIGTAEEKTNIETAHLLLKEMGLGEEMIEYVKDRPGHDRRYAIDASKLMRELGWKPEVSFEEGVQKTFNWYRENEWWWKKLKTGEYLAYYQKQYKS